MTDSHAGSIVAIMLVLVVIYLNKIGRLAPIVAAANGSTPPVTSPSVGTSLGSYIPTGTTSGTSTGASAGAVAGTAAGVADAGYTVLGGVVSG